MFASIKGSFVAINVTRVPALDTLKLTTSTQLTNLRPLHVVYRLGGWYIESLGFGMSDGQSAQTRNCDIKSQLPTNIQTIDVAFTKDEWFVHSISFQGDSILTIGGADSKNTQMNLRKGRTERFTL